MIILEMRRITLIIISIICFSCSENPDPISKYYQPEEVAQINMLISFTKDQLSNNCDPEQSDCLIQFFDQFKDIGANEEFEIPISNEKEIKLLNSIDSALFTDIWIRCEWEKHSRKDSVTIIERLCPNPEGRFVKLLKDITNKYPKLKKYGQAFSNTKDYSPAMNSTLLKYPEIFDFESKDQFFLVAIHLLTLNYPSKIISTRNTNEFLNDQKDNTIENNFIEIDSSSNTSINLSNPSVLIIELDSMEIENLKRIDGEDNFYTGTDDLMYYDYLMNNKMDSLNIPVIHTNKDLVKVTGTDTTFIVKKDDTFSFYTYFLYDSTGFKQTELFDLLDY